AQELPGPGDVRPADPGVVLGQGPKLDGALRPGQLADLPGELQDGHLAGVAQVDRLVEIGRQQLLDPVDQVVDVAEAPRLRAVAVHRDRLAAQRLAHEVRQGAAVVEPHARAVGVEDPYYPCIDTVGAVVGHDHGLGEALGLIVYTADTN